MIVCQAASVQVVYKHKSQSTGSIECGSLGTDKTPAQIVRAGSSLACSFRCLTSAAAVTTLSLDTHTHTYAHQVGGKHQFAKLSWSLPVICQLEGLFRCFVFPNHQREGFP